MSEAAALPEPELPQPDPRSGKYVIFRLANGEFGTAVHKVREVIEMLDITTVPNAPVFVAGVINLRGKVIPVVDLRSVFELSVEQPTTHSCILVVQAILASTEQMIGIVVDQVMEVLHIQSGDFLASEDLRQIVECGGLDTVSYLVGVARIGGTVKLLLDIDEVFNHVDTSRGEAMAAAA